MRQCFPSMSCIPRRSTSVKTQQTAKNTIQKMRVVRTIQKGSPFESPGTLHLTFRNLRTQNQKSQQLYLLSICRTHPMMITIARENGNQHKSFALPSDSSDVSADCAKRDSVLTAEHHASTKHHHTPPRLPLLRDFGNLTAIPVFRHRGIWRFLVDRRVGMACRDSLHSPTIR